MVRRSEDQYDPMQQILGEQPACVPCAKFVLNQLPGVMFDDACEQHEELGEVCDNMKDITQNPAKSDQLAVLPGLKAEHGMYGGHEAYRKVHLLRERDVVAVYRRTPAALNLDPYVVPGTPSPADIYAIPKGPPALAEFPVLKVFFM